MPKSDEQDKISDEKLYELILSQKHYEEERRDEINKYYISLFTGMVAMAPIIEKFVENKAINESLNNQFFRGMLLALAFIGISVSISWILTLKRIYNYLDSFDIVLIRLEEKYNKDFIRYVTRQLSKRHSPDRVTKQSMLIPITFLIIFVCSLLYNLSYFIRN